MGAEPVERTVALPGGRVLEVRAPVPDDLDRLVAFYAALPLDDVYHRFFSAFAPSRRLLESWIRAADRGGHRLVAVRDGDEVIADCGYWRLADGDAEFDIAVAADERGWLGAYLLDALVADARDQGVRNLRASVLLDNRRMLSLVRSRGYVTLAHDEHSVVTLAIGAQDAVPVWPERHGRARLVVEAAGDEWHGSDSARSYGLDVVTCHVPVEGDRPRCPAARGEICPLAGGADVIVSAFDHDSPAIRRVLAAHRVLHPAAVVIAELDAPTDPPLPADVVRVDRRDPLVAEEILRRLGRAPTLPHRADERGSGGQP